MQGKINYKELRVEKLRSFASRLINNENGRQLITEYQEYINSVTAEETMLVFDDLLSTIPLKQVKGSTGKIINVFYRSLNSINWGKPEKGHFLSLLMEENREVKKIIESIRIVTKKYFSDPDCDKEKIKIALKPLLKRLGEYELHYLKKENILFPSIEKFFPGSGCLSLMWSFHDDFRNSLKALNKMVQDSFDKELFNKEIGRLFFVVLPIIFREEQIVFPVAMKYISSENFNDMTLQGNSIGWCFIEKPALPKKVNQVNASLDGKIDLETGILSKEQLIEILSILPVDLTFVDENDTVTFFSEGPERIFPRSKAIIGRKVQNCHPPESVHIVDEILKAFRDGKKDHADFWIRLKERFIYIRYFALRDINKQYIGTLEVSQDVTEIRFLEGERRLLDWSK